MSENQEEMVLTPPEVLRDILRTRKSSGEGSKCGVCGKPGSRNHSKVNEKCPTHARAVAEDWAGTFKLLSSALGDNLIDFVQRRKFNGQLEWLRAMISKARTEHDAFQPDEPMSEREAVVKTLLACATMLGDRYVVPESGKVDMLALACKVKLALEAAIKRTPGNEDYLDPK